MSISRSTHCTACGTPRSSFATCDRCNARYCPCRAETHEGGHCRGGAK